MGGRSAAWLQWTAFALATIACLAIAVGAFRLASYSLNQAETYESPYVSLPAPESLSTVAPPPASPLATTVVLVIVDGLREDVSRTSMPTLNALRQTGSDISLVVPQPALSHPNWTTILTGASPLISGVLTNSYERPVIPPTLIDTARAAGKRVVVIGPQAFGPLYGVTPGWDAILYHEHPEKYLSSGLVASALKHAKVSKTALVVVHLPDVDEAGHTRGGGAAAYHDAAAKVDADLGALVRGLRGPGTTFVVVADHGHTDSGGHGGWEGNVVKVPGVFSGAGIRSGRGSGGLEQVAPTISVLLGLRDPAFSEAQALHSVISTDDPEVFSNDIAHSIAFGAHYIATVTGSTPTLRQPTTSGGPDANAAARDARLTTERWARLPWALGVLGVVVLILLVIGLSSWRSLVVAVAGTAMYYLIFEALFFGVHHYAWSLSALGTEERVATFMAWRLGEAATAGLVGVGVAAALYPLLRPKSRGPKNPHHLVGYLALAPAVLLVMLGSLALQVAYFVWQWGVNIVWVLPDTRLAMKYDLDLVQMTALGAAAVIAPLLTYLIRRYHPRAN